MSDSEMRNAKKDDSSNSSSKKIVDREVSRAMLFVRLCLVLGAFGLERLRSETRAFWTSRVN